MAGTAMRRFIRGKPLLVVTAAAAASAIAGCESPPVQMDASYFSGNLSIPDAGPPDTGPPDAGQPDSSLISGNLDTGADVGPSLTPDTGAVPDADVDGGP
jgi:hypothetical protein